MKKGLLAVSILVALLAMSGPASADIVHYTINLPNVGLSGFSPPYADVKVDRTGLHNATITFTSDTTSGKTFLMGDLKAADVNVNAASWTIVCCTQHHLTGFINGALGSGGLATVNGFGVFNQTVNSGGAYDRSHDMISFRLINTSASVWLTAGSVLKDNALGHPVAIHAFACTPSPCTPAPASHVGTGYATVPESASLLLLGSGLAGIGLLQWKRRKTGQA
jgi:hypothetical protein